MAIRRVYLQNTAIEGRYSSVREFSVSVSSGGRHLHINTEADSEPQDLQFSECKSDHICDLAGVHRKCDAGLLSRVHLFSS